MRCSLLILIFSVACCTDNTTAEDNLDVAGLLKIGARFILLNLKRSENLTLTDSTTFTLPDDIKNISIGSIQLENAYIYGFKDLDIKELSATNLDAPENATTTNFCLNIIIKLLGLSTIYDADIGIINEIPIYGKGELNLAASNIDLDICLNIISEQSFSVLRVEELALKLKLHDSLSSITGFWKSEEVSDIITLVISVLEQLICMFISYENECFSCVASEVVQYIINFILPNDTGDLTIDCECLLGVSSNKYNVGGILEKIVTSYFEGATSSLTEREIQDLKELLGELLQYIVAILRDKGITFE